MKYYSIHIKSHTDSPDFEYECEAKDKDEAIEIFLDMLNNNLNDDFWTKGTIEEYIQETL